MFLFGPFALDKREGRIETFLEGLEAELRQVSKVGDKNDSDPV